MSVFGRLFGKKPVQPPAAEPEQGEAEPAQAAPPTPEPAAEPPTPRPVVVTEETLGLSDEIPKTRLPQHAPVERLDVIPPERDAELKALQQYRKTPGYRNFMDKAKRPPIQGPRRLNIPEEYGGPPERKRP
jgi:hypothetical protein